jgi:uncharacterized protein with gpF-like domain
MNQTNRLILALAAMPYAEARALLAITCKRSSSLPAMRKRLQKHFHGAVTRVLKFAKHETLRKLQRYMHSHRPLHGQHSDTVRINFNLDELTADMNAMLSTELESVLNASSGATLAAVGYSDPWTLPSQDVLNFISQRQNLLADVPDEIFKVIREEISQGLEAGESLREISARISTAFDDIETGRADVIAETETAAAYAYASDQASRAAGVQYKQWLHGISKVPREDHVAVDGMIIPIDEPFPVGSPPLMYPHDPAGSPEDTINCSCMSIPVSEEEFQNQ